MRFQYRRNLTQWIILPSCSATRIWIALKFIWDMRLHPRSIISLCCRRMYSRVSGKAVTRAGLLIVQINKMQVPPKT